MSSIAVPPILATLVGRIALAVPARGRTTFLELLIGAAATKSGHVTDAILTSGLSRTWTTYFWFIERGRWSWLHVWQALLGVLTTLFAPAVWHVVVDDSVVERISTRAPGSLIHHNHTAKPNRPRFLRGQGWLCLAAVVERDFKVGAVPLMLRLVRRGTNRGKLKSARFLLRLLGQRLGRVRVLLDAWFMRGWLIRRTLADGHTVIGRVRRDLALYQVPRPPRQRRRGRPRKYGARLTPERVEALPAHRSARILYGNLEVVRWRSCRVAARFLGGMVVRVVWVQLERPDKPPEQRLLICTDPDLPALDVITAYAKRWAVEPLFKDMKHGWGLKNAWQQSRQVLMRWTTLLGVGYALTQMLAYSDPAHLDGLAEPAPWRPSGTQTAGVIQAGIARILRGMGLPAFIAAMSAKLRADAQLSGGSSSPFTTQAA
ncbi:MAG: transposase [Sinobacteraceae bacterium]|nr:transposase [Nevskiaceae bacterium]